jgi:hypothetical protein
VQALLQNGRPQFSRHSALQERESSDTESFVEAAAARQLEEIVTGNTNKSEVEIVLAHYNEDTKWSDAYQYVRTIYCKGPVKYRPEGCVRLQNVGREGHTYLYHIVKNYDTLSKWTVFSQAGPPTQGYKGHRKGGGHALPGVPFDAYLLPENAGGLPRDDGSAFVFTGALDMLTLNHSLRLSFVEAAHGDPVPTLHKQGKCPKTELFDGWQRWWDLGWFKGAIGKRCGCKGPETPKVFNHYWDEYFPGEPRPTHGIMFFTQGARFAASRERIHQRPREFYMRLLKLLLRKKDPCHNYFNEWLWYYLIGKPTTPPCDMSVLLKETNAAPDKGKEMIMHILQEKYGNLEQDEAGDSSENSEELEEEQLAYRITLKEAELEHTKDEIEELRAEQYGLKDLLQTEKNS